MLVDQLNPKQQKFVAEYVQCLNATQAAIRAGYSPKTARQQGSRLLSHVDVQAAMNELMELYAMSPQEIMMRMSAQARGDITDIIDPATMTADLNKARELGLGHLIKKVKQQTITTDEQEQFLLEVELHDAQRALFYLGKLHGMFSETLHIKDWRSEAIESIKNQEITFEALEKHLGHSLAIELFQQAGVVVSSEA